jgi:predicted TIM-barrel fold metal-dependent hydrolase
VNVHAPVRAEWLSLVEEPLMVPDMQVVDAHHHLWDRSASRYLGPELLDDLDTVPAVAATVYVQCRSEYLAEGPEELKPAGEVRFAKTVAESVEAERPEGPKICRAIVAGADLMLGSEVGRVLDVLDESSGDRLRGVRNQTAWHSDSRVTSSPFPPAPDQLLQKSFQEGARRLASRGLSLDVWAYHSQLEQVITLARACPETTIVVDHLGGPLGVGPYLNARKEVFDRWSRSITALAEHPNVFMKISGAGMRVFGFGFDRRTTPPGSDELAQAMSPYASHCLDRFGPERCMFASNFPVDKGMFSYRVLWNAFSKTAAALSPAEQRHLFHGTADSVYRLGLPLSA